MCRMKANYEGTNLPDRGDDILFSEYWFVTKCLWANVKYESGVDEMGGKDFGDNQ